MILRTTSLVAAGALFAMVAASAAFSSADAFVPNQKLSQLHQRHAEEQIATADARIRAAFLTKLASSSNSEDDGVRVKTNIELCEWNFTEFRS